jgi:hypothetical protein
MRILILIIAVLLPAAPAFAETLTAEHTYVLGDNDTKAQARKICFLEAKRKLLEKAGALVTARTELQDYRVTRDSVRSYAAAFLRVKVTQEEYLVKGESFAVRLVVTAEVEPGKLAERLSGLRDDPVSWSEVEQRADSVEKLEERALELQRLMEAERDSEALILRGEQQGVFRALEDVYAHRDLIVADIRESSRLARELVEPGMSEKEVASLLGPPRAVKQGEGRGADYRCLGYGRVWVVLKNGLTACMRESLRYEERYGGDCHCAGMAGEVFGW